MKINTSDEREVYIFSFTPIGIECGGFLDARLMTEKRKIPEIQSSRSCELRGSDFYSSFSPRSWARSGLIFLVATPSRFLAHISVAEAMLESRNTFVTVFSF